jgi:succinyl-CoA:acetate CoA-transferase
LRKLINSGEVDYIDMHLSEVGQLTRYGFLGNLDVAIVEACAITEEGHIVPTTSCGNSASYVRTADVVIVEINTSQPIELEGMHDIYQIASPPARDPIPLRHANDRIGTLTFRAIPTKSSLLLPVIFLMQFVLWPRLMMTPKL